MNKVVPSTNKNFKIFLKEENSIVKDVSKEYDNLSKIVYNKILSLKIISYLNYKTYIRKCNIYSIVPNISKIKEYLENPNIHELNEKVFYYNISKSLVQNEFLKVSHDFSLYLNNKGKFPKFK